VRAAHGGEISDPAIKVYEPESSTPNRHGYKPPADTGSRVGRREVADLVLEQAREPYRYWPEVYANNLTI
jgi:hypothetical protein